MRASATDRGVVCPASLFILHEERPPGEAAEFGTLVHYWKETGDTAPSWASDKDIRCLEKKLLLSGINRADWWDGGEHEVTFALELATRKALRFSPGTTDRDSWKKAFPPAEWLTGTIDYLWPDGDGDDLKTGRWPVDPKTSKQLRSYALLPWAEAGCPDAWDVEWSITQWPKYRLDGLPVSTSVYLDAFELEDHLDSLRWAATHPDEVHATEEGCRFCDCKPNCPAWN